MTIQPKYQSLIALKKRAKQVSRSERISHTRALEIAALDSGFHHYRGAKAFYSTHFRITAYCRYIDKERKERGTFEHSLYLTKDELEFLGSNFKRKFHYEQKERGKQIYNVYWQPAWSKTSAMHYVFQFLRKIQFSILSSTTPHASSWMNGKSRKQTDFFPDAPWSDHDCSWRDISTGGVMYIQQPYPGKYKLDGLAERQKWAETNNFYYYEFDWSLYGHGTYMIGLSPKNNFISMAAINKMVIKAINPIGMKKIPTDRYNAPYQDAY